jgi:hypothetical protein
MIFFLPGLAGFLVWEFKENWKLYRANRATKLRPVLIGHHGETLRRLLRPGIHSGTVPKLYAKLRKAERRARRTGRWKTFRKHWLALHHVGEAVRHFVERELLAPLAESHCWPELPVRVGAVVLGTNCIRVELASMDDDGSAWLAFTEQAGWLVAQVAEPGWLPALTGSQRQAVAVALAGLYKMADGELVREQLDQQLAGVGPYTIDEQGVRVWPGRGREEPAALYDLRNGPIVEPRTSDGKPAALPTLPARALLFREVPVPWQDWVDIWEQLATGKEGPVSCLDGVNVLPGATP